MLCTLRTHRSPGEWQHWLPTCWLALAGRDSHPLDSTKRFHWLISAPPLPSFSQRDMRVNSKCAHQVRPPLGRATGCSAIAQPSAGCRAIRQAWWVLLVSEQRRGIERVFSLRAGPISVDEPARQSSFVGVNGASLVWLPSDWRRARRATTTRAARPPCGSREAIRRQIPSVDDR